MTAALAAGIAAGLAGAAIVELLAERPRRPRRGHGAIAMAILAAVGRAAAARPTPPDAGGRLEVVGRHDVDGRLDLGARFEARGRVDPSDRVEAGGRLEAIIEAAGARISAGELAAMRAGAALVALAGVAPFAWTMPPRGALIVLAAAPAAAFLAPILVLRRRARRRAAVIEDEIGDVLDLLAVALDAGLAPVRAIAEVSRRRHGLLAAELRRMAARRALGVPATTVIGELERRCPTEGVSALAAALRRAERHGAPLAAALAAQSRQARSRAAARTAEAAARASPRIQLVVALLLVPSVLLLVAAGLLPALTGT